jgi:hypothetical protein
MKNKILLIGLILCQAAQLNAMDKPSVYDPLGALSAEERNRLEAEGRTIITNRKVNGQDLLIQIDFLSQNEFDEGGVTGRDESGRTLFSLGTYTNWSVRYFSQPAVLMLFVDQGDGNYALDALNFSDMLMDEGVPDLVRRYIRDEIMKKETSYVEIISSGLYAIGEALNPIYKQNLIDEHIELFNGNQYKRRYSFYSPFNYYEFDPYHEANAGGMLPDLVHLANNDVFFDWSNIEYSNTETLDITQTYEGDIPWYDQYLVKNMTTPVLREIIDNPQTAEANELLITNLFKKDLKAIANDPSHYFNENTDAHDASVLHLTFDTQVTEDFRLDYYGCRLRIFKRTLSQQWDYIPDVLNRAIYPSWGERGPTWCNQYARALSQEIFGRYIFPSLSANDLHDYMSSSQDYVKINDGETNYHDPAKMIEYRIGFHYIFRKKGY